MLIYHGKKYIGEYMHGASYLNVHIVQNNLLVLNKDFVVSILKTQFLLKGITKETTLAAIKIQCDLTLRYSVVDVAQGTTKSTYQTQKHLTTILLLRIECQ